MAVRELDGRLAAIGDLDRIGPEIPAFVRIGMLGQEFRLDGTIAYKLPGPMDAQILASVIKPQIEKAMN